TGGGDLFGVNVDVDGDVAVVAAYSEQSAATGVNGDQLDDTADSAGAAYVFTRTATTWIQRAYVKASNTGAFDYFGARLGLDAYSLISGAFGEDSSATGVGGSQSSNSATDAGA